MASLGSDAKMRAMSADSWGLPAFTAMVPSRSCLAASSMSSRRSASRVLGSVPWHWKHLSESMGRMSRLNWMSFMGVSKVWGMSWANAEELSNRARLSPV